MRQLNYLSVFVCLMVFFVMPLQAQDDIDTTQNCAFDFMHHLKMGNDSTYGERVSAMEADIYNRLKSGNSGTGGVFSDFKNDVDDIVFNIPIVVHIVHREGLAEGVVENLYDEQIETKIQELNDAFSNASELDPPNPYGGVDVGIEFCLAERDPDGNATNGIIRHANDFLTSDKVNGLSGPVVPSYQWDPYKYFNIFIVLEIADGFHAYANLASEHGQTHDGVVLAYYAETRVWVHEVGHYFNLYHTFNGGSKASCPANFNCLIDGDRVCDTPPQTKQYNYCNAFNTSPILSSCSTDTDDIAVRNPYRPISNGGLGNYEDAVFNYMSYDLCRNFFTVGQRDRMRDALLYFRSSLLSSDACSPWNVALDADIKEVVSPNGLACSDEVIPRINLNNNGFETLTSVNIDVIYDGVFQYTHQWTGSLVGSSVEEIELNPIAVNNAGLHSLYFEIQTVNGQASDDYSLNNQKYQEFSRTIVHELTLGDECNFSTYTTVNTITTKVVAPPCEYFRGGDVWFSVEVPLSGHINFEGDVIDFNDGGAALYTGECTALELVVCDANSGLGLMPRINASGLEPGSTVFLRFWERLNDEQGDFEVCVTDGLGEIADYEISNPSLNMDVSCIFGGVNMEVTVSNVAGHLSTNNVFTGFYYSDDDQLSSDDYYLGRVETIKEDLGINESVTINKGVYIPALSSTNSTNYIIAIADYQNSILEANEANNVIAHPIFIEDDLNYLADLYTTNEQVFPTKLAAGDNISIGATYHNGGNGATGVTTLRYYISTDTLWNVPDSYLSVNQHNGFLPNSSENVSVSYPLPSYLAPGDYYMLFISDENGNAFESNEDNNIKYVPFTVTPSPQTAEFYFRMYLEGFYDADMGEMTTELNDDQLLPFKQPYNQAPWNYDGVETLSTFPSDMSDWILVEAYLGDPNSAQSASEMTLVESRAAILLKDGWIVDLDGMSYVKFYDLDLYEQYYFVIRHRNHVDVMTKYGFTPSYNSSQQFNFTTSPFQAFGNDQLTMVDNGKFAAFAGDFDGNGIVNVLDYNLWQKANAVFGQYVSWDGTGNGIANVNDINLWTKNKSKLGIPEVWY